MTGCKGCLITQPEIDLLAHPILEAFFISLRVLERCCLKLNMLKNKQKIL